MNVRNYRQFARSVLFLVAALFLLDSAFIALGGQQATPEDYLRALGLGLCNGKACFLGITPGQTTWLQGQAMLASHGSTTLDANGLHYNKATLLANAFNLSARYHNPLNISSLPPGDGPDTIDISVSQVSEHVDVSQVMQMFGPPCGVSLFPNQCFPFDSCPGWALLTLNYPSARFDIPLDSQPGAIPRLNPLLPVTLVEIFDPTGLPSDSKTCTVRLRGQIDSVNAPWRGFASIDSYFQHGQKSNAPVGSP
jgi:hypothetical protein